MIHTESEVQNLQKRVVELERQLAEARATISTLTLSKRKKPHRPDPLQDEQTLCKRERQEGNTNFLANEERLQSMLMIAPYPLMIRREDGRVLMVNAAWTEITGYSLEDIPTIAEWTRKAYGEHAPERQSFIHNQGFSQENIKKWGEFEVTTRSGEKRVWDFSTAPLGLDENGRELVMTMAVDVTDRKVAEANLRSARDEAIWLARLPGENPNPVARISREGIVLYHNRPAANLPGWICALNEPLFLPLRPIVHQALTQDQIVGQEVTLGTKIYSVSVVPLREEGYANLYGRDVTEQKEAETALRASEERYRAVVENAIDAIVVTDPSQRGKVLSVNPAACRMFGYRAEEFLSLDREGMLDMSDPRLAAFLRRRQRRGQLTGQLTYKRKNGTRFSGEISSVFYRDRNGEQRAVAIIRDITERAQFEIALRKRESILAQAGEMAHLGAWDIEFNNRDDVNANPLSWSDEVYRIFGYTPGEVRPSNELFFERVHPDDRVLVQESVAQAIATRQPYVIEHRIRRPDGEERVVQEHAEVFFDETGQPLRIVGAVQDITERKRAEAAMRESEERFRSLADSMPQLVWTALPDGTVDYYNQRYQEYWEIKQVEIAAWEWAPVLHPDDLQPTLNAWRHSVETGEIYQIEHRVHMTDGSYRWHLSRGIPMFDRNGQITHWFGTATDIHEQKSAQEKLEEYAEKLERSNRELEQFAFMASHDLQEPLRKIEMFGDLLLDCDARLDDQARDYINRMQNAAARMHDMVDGLLQLSRVATQGKPFVRVNLSQVISDVLSALGDQVRRAGGRLEFSPLPVVEGDPLQLRQLMQNLISNALKYHQPGIPPKMRVYATQLPEKVQICVEDNGIGFEQADAERIFQPFQRLVGRSEYEGSGMGLAICHRIVERHGGEIVARSQPGRGTTMIVTLPLHRQPA